LEGSQGKDMFSHQKLLHVDLLRIWKGSLSKAKVFLFGKKKVGASPFAEDVYFVTKNKLSGH